MELNTIYIISWFGPRGENKIRHRRVDYHNRQIKWAKDNNLNIVVLAQDYDEDEYADGVTYIKNTGDLLPPAAARNLLLKEYYKTNADFAIFADNDCVLYHSEQHKDSVDFVARLQALDVDHFKHVGLILPQNPAQHAFSKELEKPIYKSHYTFHRTSKVGGGFMVIKNFKKHLAKEIYFDDKMFTYKDGQLFPGEDTDFSFTLWNLGQGSYRTIHALMCEYGRKWSTWVDNQHARYHFHINDFVPAMNAKHGHVYLTGTGSANLLKGYSYYGMSRSPNGEAALRFATDAKERTSKLRSAGHTEIQYHPLPTAMHIPDMIPTLESSNLYNTNSEFKSLVDKMSGKGGKKQMSGHTIKLKTFTNWDILDPNDLPKKFHIPKDGSFEIDPSEELFAELFAETP